MNMQYKILIADDSSAARDSVAEMLSTASHAKYSFVHAANGKEACISAFEERPALILMTLELPVMSGIEAIKKIKSNYLLKHIPIIAVSATKNFEEAFVAGTDDFLLKPFEKYELLMRVQQNIKLSEKVIEIKKQHDILKAEKHKAVSHRDIILQQQTKLVEDLEYAQFVQHAILPSTDVFKELFRSYFVFNKPKNIVSGDFYWITQKNGKTFIAVGDCTGHGLSGALMTMAGAAFLNEIVNYSPHFDASKILNELRIKVIQLLNQKGNIGEAANGMDIALCIIDNNSNTIEFSGANNSIYLVHNNELEALKGDRMPIGFYFNNDQPFSKFILNFSEGDYLYLFTDGYPDQFGGPLEQKFRYNQFKELILKVSSLPDMQSQYNLINNVMEDWMHGHEQVDDMLIVGLQF